MVSTRQMATSGSNTSGQQPQSHHAPADSTRATVVTRQSSTPAIWSNGQVSLPPSDEEPGEEVSVRHSHLTLALKASNGDSGTEAAVDGANPSPPSVGIEDLPVEIMDHLISYMDFKRVAQLRLVSRRFNDVCMHLLNSTFVKLITQTSNRFHTIKSQMPRRESARRNHPLACECDIVETCYMRLSLLQMTFGKHIERGHCCFFPGGILDEIIAIMSFIKSTPEIQRPFRVTDELFDLSTMAMEYFRDHLESTLPDLSYYNKTVYKLPSIQINGAPDLSDSASTLGSPPPQSNMVLRKGIRKIKQGMKMYNNQLSVLRNELRTSKRKAAEHSKQIAEQQKLLTEQQKQMLEYANRFEENDKKNEELTRKFSTLLQELNKCKTELQYWRSKSPAVPSCTSCGQLVKPLLQPEDYQALINQGIRPEDIVLTGSEESVISRASDPVEPPPSVAIDDDGVSPDASATAKALVATTAPKGLKRKHSAVGVTQTNLSCGGGGAGGALKVIAKDVEKPPPFCSTVTNSSEMNDLIYLVNSAGGRSGKTTNPDAVAACSGYGTKQIQKSVIVSPSAAIVGCLREDAAHGTAGCDPASLQYAPSDQNAGSNGDCMAPEEEIAAEQVETKKARRVQKATRLLNASGKRSK